MEVLLKNSCLGWPIRPSWALLKAGPSQIAQTIRNVIGSEPPIGAFECFFDQFLEYGPYVHVPGDSPAAFGVQPPVELNKLPWMIST